MTEVNPQVRIAITMDDGTVAVMAFITKSRSPTLPKGAVWLEDGYWYREPNDANIFAEITKAFRPVDSLGIPLPQPTSYKVITTAEEPSDRAYRNAWVFDGKKIVHDMPKARAIHLDKVRRARTRRMGELDVMWSRAAARNDKQAAEAIEAERQALRDAPATLPVDSAQTVDELKAIWPADLPR